MTRHSLGIFIGAVLGAVAIALAYVYFPEPYFRAISIFLMFGCVGRFVGRAISKKWPSLTRESVSATLLRRFIIRTILGGLFGAFGGACASLVIAPWMSLWSRGASEIDHGVLIFLEGVIGGCLTVGVMAERELSSPALKIGAISGAFIFSCTAVLSIASWQLSVWGGVALALLASTGGAVLGAIHGCLLWHLALLIAYIARG